MRILTGADLQHLLPMADTIELVEAGFQARGSVPTRLALEVDGVGESLFMPGYLPERRALGLKVISLFPGNAARGLPAAMGAMLLLDPATGAPAALLDGTFLTTLRTGALTGLATRALARPDAATAAVLGAGGLAWHQAEAVCAVRPIREVRLWNRTRERAEALAGRARSSLAAAVRVCGSADEAVAGAGVVVCCTSSPAPVLRAAWLAPGAHVNAVGAFRPDMREIEPEVARRATRRVVDTLAAARTGDLAGLDPGAEIVELGAVLQGRAEGRPGTRGWTLFKSVGFAALDLAVAADAVARAVRRGCGREVELL